MEKETFYISLTNRHYRHENGRDDYHIEKIASKEKVLELLSETNEFSIKENLTHEGYGIIITNDKSLLSKYISTVNEEEFKSLCRIKEIDKNKIRINIDYFDRYNNDVFEYFEKIRNGELISANMDFENEVDYPYDDPTIGIHSKSYQGWIENMEFSYFETPSHYKTRNSSEIFSFQNVKVGDINLFKKIINVNLLEIGFAASGKNWDYVKDGIYKFFDNISYIRLYIPEKILNELRENPDFEFKVETKLTKDYYIEYHITELLFPYDDYDYRENNDGENRSYEKYQGYNGFSDDVIDDAFDGDPDLTWNVD